MLFLLCGRMSLRPWMRRLRPMRFLLNRRASGRRPVHMRYRLRDRVRVLHRMFVAARRRLRRGMLLLGIRRVRLLRLLLLPNTLGLVLGKMRSMYRGLVANVFR
jgi:hypothetical protein